MFAGRVRFFPLKSRFVEMVEANQRGRKISNGIPNLLGAHSKIPQSKLRGWGSALFTPGRANSAHTRTFAAAAIDRGMGNRPTAHAPRDWPRITEIAAPWASRRGVASGGFLRCDRLIKNQRCLPDGSDSQDIEPIRRMRVWVNRRQSMEDLSPFRPSSSQESQ